MPELERSVIRPQPTPRYKSLIDIVSDPLGRALAYAQDMSYKDWLNFQMKTLLFKKKS